MDEQEQPDYQGHLDPWIEVQVGDDHFLFGYALFHRRLGGLSWLMTSPVADADYNAGWARTASGSLYRLGTLTTMAAIQSDQEALLAYALLVLGNHDSLERHDLWIRWLSARKWSRWLGVEPPALDEAEVTRFIDRHWDDYHRVRERAGLH